MSIIDRILDLFRAKTNKLLDILEDPNEMMDLSYEKMLEGLQATKKHLADVVAQQKSIERQMTNADQEIAGAENDAVTATKAERDDLARAALVHRRHAMDRKATLQAAHNAIEPQVQKLIGYQKQWEEKIENFRTQKETMKASYAAAKAQVRVTESMTGVGGQLGKVGSTYQRAEDRMLKMRDKAEAMDSLVQQGLLTDPTDQRDSATRELQQIKASQDIEDDLALLKAQLGTNKTPKLSS